MKEFDPADWRMFLYIDLFVRDCNRLGLTREDLRAMEMVINANPDVGKVVAGAGGLRKMRYAPFARSGGKSGGIRVCYAVFERFGRVVLVAAYAKNEASNLTAAERKAIKLLLHRMEIAFEKE